MKKRFLSILLILCMVLTMLPVSAGATEELQTTAVSSVDDHAAARAYTIGMDTNLLELNAVSHSHDNQMPANGTLATGEYYLSENVNATSDIIISGEVTICLNGCTLDLQNQFRIEIPSGSTLTLCDCQGSTGAVIRGGNRDAIDVKGTFYMDSGKITQSCRGVYVDGGSFTMNGGEISDNTATSGEGGGVYVTNGSTGGTFIMNDGKISNNEAHNGGGVYVSGWSTVTMNGGEISGNEAINGNGGGVYMFGGTFIMNNDASISNNSASNGGGISMSGYGAELTMNGGAISGNIATGNGGGVYCYVGTLTVSGTVSITSNRNSTDDTANNAWLNNLRTITIGGQGLNANAKISVTMEQGSGTFVNSGATAENSRCFRSDNDAYFVNRNSEMLELVDAATTHNHYVCGESSCSEHERIVYTGTSSLGGVLSAGKYYLSGPIDATDNITINSEIHLCLNGQTLNLAGHHIIVQSGGSLTLCDCTGRGIITGSSAENGGAVSVENIGSFTMHSGTITGNTGDGVEIASGATFTLSGAAKINGNTTANVRLASGATITLGQLEPGALIGVTMDSSKGIFVSSGATSGDENYFFSDNTLYAVSQSGSTLQLVDAVGHTHNDIAFTSADSFESLKNALTSGTSCYLMEDVTLTESITVSGTVNLCLNGHTLNLTEDLQLIVPAGTALNLYDCRGNTGKITGRTAGGYVEGTGYGAIKVDGGTFTMYGGTISENKSMYGGGVYIASGSFTMNNGIISGNTANGSGGGGGVYIVSGSFTMHNGTISNNSAGNGGGIYAKGDSFTMNNGTISGNTADGDGGGVYVKSGSFTMNNGTISGNTAETDGGGVFVSNSAAFTMEDGTIDGNIATQYAGGVYVSDDAAFIMRSGEIVNNEGVEGRQYAPEDYGGGVGVGSTGSVTISGAVNITGNTFKEEINNIYLNDGAKITLDGSLEKGSKIGVTMSTPGVFTSGWNDHMPNAVPTDYFTSDNAAKGVRIQGDELTLGKSIHIHEDGTAFPTEWSGSRTETSITDTQKIVLNANTTLTNPLTISNGANVTICLNGKTLATTGISVVSGTLTVCDCLSNGSITGAVTVQGGRLILNSGSLTGGVQVNIGSFTMNGGSITGKHVTGNGGGVQVSGGSFTMYNGSITANSATGNGGGVYVSGGSFLMNGGSITGNNATGNGGGVYVSGGSFLISGTPQITNNNMNDSTTNGVYLANGTIIQLNGKLQSGASIGVTMETLGTFTNGWKEYMSDAAPGDYFSAGLTEDIIDKDENGELKLRKNHTHVWSTEWTSDANAHWRECTEPNCDIVDNSQMEGYAQHTAPADDGDCTTAVTCATCGYVLAAAKSHAFTKYTVNGDTITVHCANDGCNVSGGTAKIQIPEDASLTYTGSPIEVAEVVYSDDWKGDRNHTITYTGDHTNAGNTGTASVTIGGVTANITFTVEHKAFADGDVQIDSIPDQTYNGSPIEPDVTIVYNGKKLQKDQDYTLSYQGNDKVGEASVTIQFTGNFSGQTTTTFEIVKGTAAKPGTGEGYTIDYADETISVEEGYEIYSKQEDGTKITTGSITDYLGQTIYIRQEGTANMESSDWTEIQIAARPSTPAAPTITEKTNTSITIETVDGNEYAIDRGDGVLTWIPGDGSSHTFEDLQPGTDYTIFVRVEATEDAPASDSSAVEVTTKPTPPNAVTEPEDENITDTSITIPTEIGKEYAVVEKGQTPEAGDWVSGDGTPHTFEGLKPGTDYTIHVRVEATEEVPASDSSTTEVTTKPTQPGAVTIPDENITDTSITIETVDGNEYAIDKGDGVLTWIPGDGSSHTFEDLQPGTDYTIHVRVEATEDAPASDSSTVEVTTKPTPPDAVTEPEDENITDTSITIPTEIGKEYAVVEKGETPGNDDWVSGDGDSHTFEGLKPGTDYTIHVRVEATEEVPASDSSTTEVTTKPTQPGAVTIPDENITDTSITIETVDGNEYAIDKGDGVLTWIPGDGSSHTFEDLQPGTDYTIHVRVEATEDAPASDSSIVEVTTKPTPPDAVAEPEDENITDTSITIPTEIGKEYAVVEKGETPGIDDWVTGTGEEIEFRPLDRNTEYDILVRIPANTSENIPASNPSKTTVTTDKTIISVTWANVTQTYDGEAKKPKANISSTLQVTISVEGDAGINTGSYPFMAVLSGADAADCELSNATATLTIRPKTVTAMVKNSVVQENGSAQTPEIAASGMSAADYTVTYLDNNGQKQNNLVNAGTYQVWVEITNSNYTFTDGSSNKQVGTFTITKQPLKTYTVCFEGGVGTEGTAPTTLTVLANQKITLPINSFRKAEYTFTGWKAGHNNRVYQPGDVLEVPAQDVTFTAQWEPVFSVTITVEETTENGLVPASNAVVSLWRGANMLSEITTDQDGRYIFDDLITGIYNLVVTKDQRIVTSMVEIIDENEETTALLPQYITNSVVDITHGTPDIIVGKLDEIFEKTDENVFTQQDQATVEDGGKVEFTFSAQEKKTDTGDETESTVAADLNKIETIASGSNLGLVLDYKLKKAVTASGETEPQITSIPVSNVLLEILLPLPAELQGKAGYTVYRVHEGVAQELKQSEANKNELGEYFTVNSDKTGLTLHVKCFSTYAIGYMESSGNNDNSNTSIGGGGSSTPTYSPSITQPEHGTVTVSPNNPQKGDSVTITAKPEDGYTVDTVTVTDEKGQTVTVTPNSDGTYTFVQPGSKVTVTVTFRDLSDVSSCLRDESCPMASFNDTDRTAWYHDGVHYCVEQGLMVGTSKTTFTPNGATTRGMVVTILWRQAGSPIVDVPMEYQDVASDAWYGEAVRWASSEGIVTGYGNGKFGPNNPITREQMATMLWRYAQYQKMDVSVGENTNILSYEDASAISEYAIPAMQWACGAGIIQGVGGGMLNPTGTATRAQVACIFQRFDQQ